MKNQQIAVVEIIEINPREPQQELAPKPRPEYLCRHIFTDGRRCAANALRNQHFCFYHYNHCTPVPYHQRSRRPKSGFDLTRLDGLDNPTAIQLALSEVIGRIASNNLDTKRAALLLYGLQIAGNNLRRTRPSDAPVPDAIVEDADYGQLAELEEGRTVPDSIYTRLRAELDRSATTGTPLQLPEDFPEEIKEDFENFNLNFKDALKEPSEVPV